MSRRPINFDTDRRRVRSRSRGNRLACVSLQLLASKQCGCSELRTVLSRNFAELADRFNEFVIFVSDDL